MSARFDVGGFGAGSRIAVNAEPLLNLKNNKHLTTSIGWKFLYQDFVDSGRGFDYDVLMQGPMVGFTIKFCGEIGHKRAAPISTFTSSTKSNAEPRRVAAPPYEQFRISLAFLKAGCAQT